MQKNMGMIDRGFRLVVGVLLLSLVFIGPQTLWGLAGLILVATSGLSFCPLYTIVGIKTCKDC